MIEITTNMLNALRKHVGQTLSPKRFAHTVAVEEMVVRLCALYCPEEELPLRAAALLHDRTKELSTEEQIALSKQLGLPVSQGDKLSPKTFHARTASALIPVEYPQFAHPTVVSAVRWHTTGHAGMTLTEKLLYLADYIDDSRTFPSCVMLRKSFWDADPASMSKEARESLLCDVLLLSYDMTIHDLLAEKHPIDADTIASRNELLAQKANAAKT